MGLKFVDKAGLELNTPPHKLYHANSPDTSKEAAYAVDTNKWEEIVYQAICSFRGRGCIQDEVIEKIAESYGAVPYSTVTARFKALEEAGLITYRGKRKGNSGRFSRVRVATKWVG